MKKLTLLLASVFGLVSVSMAHGYGHAQINSYADAFVFDEMGVTFSVYPDGEFDFYMDGLNQTSTVSNGYVDVTFNSGYNYSPYVQYDDFGAVIQVENVPIYYDYYGRVSQVGDVLINYRNRRVCQVGGMYVHYNRYGHYAYHTGYINVWNPYFVYRPFYVAFARPAINLCFVRTTPYRQYYRPVRYTYYRPYVRNVRPCYATVGTVYRPRSGYGQVHGRYTQTANRGERPVMRERRKITTATANARPVVTNRSNAASRSNANGYTRSTNAAKPASTRTVNRSAVNARSGKPNTSSVSSNTRSVQSSPARTSGSRTTTARATTTRQPSSTSRSVKPQTSGRATQTRTSSSNARAVKPTSTTRRSTAQKPTTTSRTSSSGTRAVKPSSTSRSSSSSRSSASKPRTTSKPTSTVNRSSSRSSASKGKSSSVKSGGKVSVGNQSSKGGR